MRQEEQQPKAFKSSIWYTGLMVSGFCLFAGLVFFNSPVVSESEAAAQSCHCHPNKVPSKVEGNSNATIEIRNEETGETITVPKEFHTESHWHEGTAF